MTGINYAYNSAYTAEGIMTANNYVYTYVYTAKGIMTCTNYVYTANGIMTGRWGGYDLGLFCKRDL